MVIYKDCMGIMAVLLREYGRDHVEKKSSTSDPHMCKDNPKPSTVCSEYRLLFLRHLPKTSELHSLFRV